MGWITGIVGIGILIALNFVKASSLKGTMKLAIYGVRIISLLCIVWYVVHRYQHNHERCMTFMGKSLTPISKDSFIGEWGWVKANSQRGETVITFDENGEFYEVNSDAKGQWVFDDVTNELYLHYPNETRQFLVQGKSGLKITFIRKTRLFVRDEEYTLIHRSGNDKVKSSISDESDGFTYEDFILFIAWLFVLAIGFLFFSLIALLFFYVRRKSLSNEELVTYGKVKKTAELTFNTIFYFLIIGGIMQSCSS